MQLAQLTSCPRHATLSLPPSKSNLAEARSSYLTEYLPFETKNTLSGVNHYSRNHFVAQVRPWMSARVRQAPGIAPPWGQAASVPRRAPNKGQGRVPVGAAASAGSAAPSGRPERKKRPLRAERPVLPRPGAAVLSARWGLTAEFGMGSGDPPLHGSARGRRSRGNRLAVRGARGSPAPPWRLHARDTSIDDRRT